MKKFMHYMNENHWYIIAAIVICFILIWLFGCESQVQSMITPNKQVTRPQLQLESEFLLGQVRLKLADLDKQDEIKKLILDQAAIFSQSGTLNYTGLLNTIVSIGAISFGMNRNQKLNALAKAKPTTEPES